MPGPANSLNINEQGVQYFDGVSVFTGIDGSTSGDILTSNGTGVAPSFKTPSSSGIVTINGDTGSVTGSVITIKAGEAATTTCTFNGSGTTLQFNVTDSNGNTIIGAQSTGSVITGTVNTGIGDNVLNGLTSGVNNVACGSACMYSLTTGIQNSSLGNNSMAAMINGNYNVGIGYRNLYNLLSGTQNCCLGYQAGYYLNGSESNNIYINHSGLGQIGVSNQMIIGQGTGTGPGQLSKAFICGINGNTTANPVFVTVDTVTQQLGTSAGPTGPGSKVLLQAQTVSGVAAVNFTTGFGGYSYYYLEGYSILGSSSFTNTGILQLSVNAGSTYISTGNTTAVGFTSSGGNAGGQASTLQVINNNSTDATAPSTFWCNLYNLDSNTLQKTINGKQTNYLDTVGILNASFSGLTSTTATVNGLRFLMSDASTFSGTFRLFGVV